MRPAPVRCNSSTATLAVVVVGCDTYVQLLCKLRAPKSKTTKGNGSLNGILASDPTTSDPDASARAS